MCALPTVCVHACEQGAIKAKLDDEEYLSGYNSDAHVALVRTSYARASMPCLEAWSPTVTSPPSAAAGRLTSSITSKVAERHMELVVSHLAEISSTMRQMVGMLDGKKTRVRHALGLLQDGAVQDSDSDCTDTEVLTKTSGADRRAKGGNGSKTSKNSRKRSAPIDVDADDDSESERKENEPVLTQLSSQLSSVPTDLAAASAAHVQAPAGKKSKTLSPKGGKKK